MPELDRKLALAFVTELEKALKAIRSGDVDGISYAEVQPTLLFLLEQSESIHSRLREPLRGFFCESTADGSHFELADSDIDLATMMSGFFEVIFDLVNDRPSS